MDSYVVKSDEEDTYDLVLEEVKNNSKGNQTSNITLYSN